MITMYFRRAYKMTITLKADVRTETTKSEIKQLRQEGKIPAVVYGRKLENTAITIDEKQLITLLRGNPHAVVEMDIATVGTYPVMVNDLQRDKLYRNILHLDFHQINMDEPVKATVGIQFTGEPKGEAEGGMLSTPVTEIEIRCLPQQIPDKLEVDVSRLALGESLVLRDIVLPDGIELKSDPDVVLATVLAPQKERAVEDAEAVKELVEEAAIEETDGVAKE
jgi:large subunit ribosomal protein L25